MLIQYILIAVATIGGLALAGSLLMLLAAVVFGLIADKVNEREARQLAAGGYSDQYPVPPSRYAAVDRLFERDFSRSVPRDAVQIDPRTNAAHWNGELIEDRFTDACPPGEWD